MFSVGRLARRAVVAALLCASASASAQDAALWRVDPEYGPLSLVRGAELAELFGTQIDTNETLFFTGTLYCLRGRLEECAQFEVRDDRVILLAVPGGGRLGVERTLFVYHSAAGYYALLPQRHSVVPLVIGEGVGS